MKTAERFAAMATVVGALWAMAMCAQYGGAETPIAWVVAILGPFFLSRAFHVLDEFGEAAHKARVQKLIDEKQKAGPPVPESAKHG